MLRPLEGVISAHINSEPQRSLQQDDVTQLLEYRKEWLTLEKRTQVYFETGLIQMSERDYNTISAR